MTDNWRTPPKIYDKLNREFNFDFDPCPPDHTFDGLKVEWGRSNFVNPPYSNTESWVKKALLESRKNKICVMLLPADTSTDWFHKYCLRYGEIRFIKRKIQFVGAKWRAPFPSIIVIFKPNGIKQSTFETYEITGIVNAGDDEIKKEG